MKKFSVVIKSQIVLEGDTKEEIEKGTKECLGIEDFLPFPDGVTIEITEL